MQGKKLSFEDITDILYVFLKFQFFYCLLLFIEYLMYQNRIAEFKPLMTILLFPMMLFISEAAKRIRSILVACSISILGSIGMLFLLPLKGIRLLFFGIVLLTLAVTFIKKKTNLDREARMYATRFRQINRQYYWGGGMIFVFLIHLGQNSKSEEVFAIAPEVCQNYMMLSFGLYIVTTILLGYAFRYMDYYRQYANLDMSSERQIKRSMYVMTGLLLFVVTLVILFGTAPIMKISNQILAQIANFFFAGYFFLASKLGTVSKTKDIASSGKVDVSKLKLPKSSHHGNGGFDAVFPILLVIFIVAAVGYVIWKFYKHTLANYTLENDTVEYIPVRKDSDEIEDIKKPLHKMLWGDSNNEKIRKYYFKEIKKRIKADRRDEVKGLTPKELVGKVCQHGEHIESLRQLTGYYEKARYSNQECSPEEVLASKNMVEQIKR